MTIRGVVSEVAHGTAKKRNKKVEDLLYARLPGLRGFYLGTLNIRVTAPRALNIKKLSSSEAVSVSVPETAYWWRKKPIPPEEITFIPVLFSVPDRVPEQPGFLYIASRSSRPRRGILELIGRENLRGKYGVRDGDRVEVKIPADPPAPAPGL